MMLGNQMLFPPMAGLTQQQKERAKAVSSFMELQRHAQAFASYTFMEQLKRSIDEKVPIDLDVAAKQAWDFAEAFEREAKHRAEKMGLLSEKNDLNDLY